MLKFDYTNIQQEVIGYEHGIDIEFEFANYSQKIATIINDINHQRKIHAPTYHWLDYSPENKIVQDILEYAESVRGKFLNIVIVGIGAPILGIRTLLDSLLKPFWNSLDREAKNNYPNIVFMGDIDPDNVAGITNFKNIDKSLFLIISQDGLNPDSMALFMLAKRRLEFEIGSKARENIVVCTQQTSLLRQIANQEGYKCFDVPESAIPRFSLFTSCGLVPLALFGIDIIELLNGVKDFFELSLIPSIYKNPAAQTALFHFLLYKQKNKYISVIMPYSTRLKCLPYWCTQIKGESLIKNINNDGKYLPTGQIPYATYGSGDQHSLLQMLTEGPNNKIINILKVEKFDTDYVIPDYYDSTCAGYLSGKTLTNLIEIQINSIKTILTENKRPNILITLPQISPYDLGQFMALYMINMPIQAALYNINPFSHTRYENLQNYTFAQLGKYGYEETLKEYIEKNKKISSLSVLPE